MMSTGWCSDTGREWQRDKGANPQLYFTCQLLYSQLKGKVFDSLKEFHSGTQLVQIIPLGKKMVCCLTNHLRLWRYFTVPTGFIMFYTQTVSTDTGQKPGTSSSSKMRRRNSIRDELQPLNLNFLPTFSWKLGLRPPQEPWQRGRNVDAQVPWFNFSAWCKNFRFLRTSHTQRQYSESESTFCPPDFSILASVMALPGKLPEIHFLWEAFWCFYCFRLSISQDVNVLWRWQDWFWANHTKLYMQSYLPHPKSKSCDQGETSCELNSVLLDLGDSKF